MSNYILCADIHSRYSIPENRIDDFRETQIRKYTWLNEQKEKYDATILSSGDITNKARPDNITELLNEIIYPYMPDMYGIAGNHDLLNHRMSQFHKSLIGILHNNKKYTVIDEWIEIDNDIIYGFNFGSEITKPSDTEGNKTIAIYHGFVSQKEDYHIKGQIAKEILKEFPDYDIILTGDNHNSFVVKYEDRYLVNPGCFTRQKSDKMNFKPCVYLYDSDEHKLTKLFIPIEKNVFNIEFIEQKKEKEKLFDSFIETVNNSYEIGASFKDNMDNYFTKNETRKPVKNIIYEGMEAS